MFPSIKKLKEDSDPSAPRFWYNEWVEKNAKGKVLDVGKSRFWSYGFPTLDKNKRLKPTFVDDICDCNLRGSSYDMVLCNGMYECVDDQQKMVKEVCRLLKLGGTAIFGFVNENYYSYKKGRKHYTEGDIKFPVKIIKTKLFNNYVFLICRKRSEEHTSELQSLS